MATLRVGIQNLRYQLTEQIEIEHGGRGPDRGGREKTDPLKEPIGERIWGTVFSWA